MSKSGSNYGSIKKLNWRSPKFSERVTKSSSIEENNYGRRFGSPLTRNGGFNGHTSALKPAIDFSGNTGLFLKKAVLQPVKYGPGGAQFQRKRDASGKFAAAQQTESQSTAEEDQINQQRDARLRQHRMLNKLRGKEGGEEIAEKALPPGSSTIDAPMSSNVNDTNSKVIGQTSSGQPIFEDPYHSAHANFSDQDHKEASDIHAGMAKQSQMAGDANGALKHSSSSNAHKNAAQSAMTPGARFADNAMNNPEADMNQFMDLLGVDQSQTHQKPLPGEIRSDHNPKSPSAATGGPSFQQGAPGVPSAAGAQNMPGTDSLSSYLDQDPSKILSADQNKPLAGTEMAGPKPGMVHTATGMPTGPQTEVKGPPSSPKGNDALMDMLNEKAPSNQPLSNQSPQKMPEDKRLPGQAPPSGGQPQAKDMNSPDSHPGFPGPTSASNEEEDKKKESATFKAIRMLKNYL